MKKEYGQYFTTSKVLQEKVCYFIQNNPNVILEPSIGRGDLVECILTKYPKCGIDMYEIDDKLCFLSCVQKHKNSLVIGDFLSQNIKKKYTTIVGNPPYVKHKKGNLYIDFTKKCFELLGENGELIFIVPSAFFKLTSTSKLLQEMMEQGTFTHIFHPHNENLFEDASIDVIVYRYCKNNQLEKNILYNNELKYILNNNGMITFLNEKSSCNSVLLGDYFDLYVGIVSGKDNVFKNKNMGNIRVLNSNKQIENFIYIDCFPTPDPVLNKYMEKHKKELITRKIRKFNDQNWFEWGAPRNIKNVEKNIGKECIYVCNITRKIEVAFVGKVQYFGGTLIMLIPKFNIDLPKIVNYLNSETFKSNFMFSGRFKIGHRQLANSILDKSLFSR
jgi:adenine-specific DNA-methyltransferase